MKSFTFARRVTLLTALFAAFAATSAFVPHMVNSRFALAPPLMFRFRSTMGLGSAQALKRSSVNLVTTRSPRVS